MSNLAIALMQKLLIFDYATEFYRKHQDIPSPETFEITDEIYADFCRYLKEKNLTYNTVTERFIKDLREVAKQEKYDDAIEQQLKEMESRLATEKESDLQKHRDEVSDMLKAEILTRYYYDQGRLKGALKSDKVVLRAVEELGKTRNEKK
jgi:carboxyl-terminal processing protease